ncbi:molybdenum cofactor biosynthesis enzyme [Streptomyces sp. CBMA291]|nr:molybdenum cofactor biosynthesis enzyme [Streptomyces sp. CBMA291]MBD0716687.1 molybdenum cofactor biosynthesis enzyme [Streptomyces sp. CBMA370]
MDRTLRIKVIDACGMTCTFCHNEGTPVTSDNHADHVGEFVAAGRSGRVSIYLATNGARFITAPVFPDHTFRSALAQLRDALDFDEIHLTGGEPTLHPHLAQIVAVSRSVGCKVSVTSNGENGARILPGCAAAGEDHVNFSIFGTTAEELAQVQNSRYGSRSLAGRKIDALEDSITLSLDLGLDARANVVIPNRHHVRRVHRLLEKHSPKLSVRVLSSLADGQESLDAIELLLDEMQARPTEVRLIAGTSGFRIGYQLPDSRTLFVKHIRSLRLPETCAGCQFGKGTDCHEGYYGVRLYRDARGTFHVGVCIQRMDLCLPLEEFITSNVCGEIRKLREQDHRDLTA